MKIPIATLREDKILECLKQFNPSDTYVYDGHMLYKITEEKDSQGLPMYRCINGEWERIK